ncbi:hypothetical protein FBZ96_105697 [Bradyrhizobium stylosanthis]|uniref:Uncharacterized protein n=1 Tax=Bradyrhizobium stylosanthis TaxID=1803665 RepID=A0A560DPH4_9BRAD|nr:hypothetical protein FBZ96_105697 [Bradyrhizobium stylosanthis]
MHSGTGYSTVVGFDDIHFVARLGSFLMISAQAECVVAEVVGLPVPGRPGGGDGQIDKTNLAKFLDVVPVGMLRLRPVTSFVLESQSSHRSFQTRSMFSITSSIAIYDTEADAVQSWA